MKRLIVTDSTADIPEDLVSQYGIKVLPVNLILEGKSYSDGKDISRESFYNSFDRYKEMRSEAVRYEDYGLEFLQMVQEYDEIIIIHCSRHLSATYDTAIKVMQDFKGDGSCRVEVIDSGQCSMGLGMIVLAAAEAMEQDMSFGRIISIANKTRAQMRSYMAIPTLKYLKKNKKIGGMKALFGSAMGVKPVLEMSQGKMVIKSKLFGDQKNMILAMMDKIKEDVGGRSITLSIIYSGNSNLVQNLRDVFETTFDCKKIYISRFGPSVAINTGPESYAAFFTAHR
ncbi:DegV family protein [Desulfopila inferna]|uniref:DegV family protein n=1 Tax=Desulfopila inferna TaxID=468528 RepID=UPI0019647593|nr:DegV family protein [Desulfopila inferna]MBM9606574.1 DegV family protein [Desulfopila inferna]